MQATALSLATMAGMVSFNAAFGATGGKVAMITRPDGKIEFSAPAPAANDNAAVKLVASRAAKADPVRKVAMDPEQMFSATNREFLPWS